LVKVAADVILFVGNQVRFACQQRNNAPLVQKRMSRYSWGPTPTPHFLL
jgi:hypothetical protein